VFSNIFSAYKPAWLPLPADAREFEEWTVNETDGKKLLAGLVAVMEKHPSITKARAIASRETAGRPARERAARTLERTTQAAIFNSGILGHYIAEAFLLHDIDFNIQGEEIGAALLVAFGKVFDDDLQEIVPQPLNGQLEDEEEGEEEEEEEEEIDWMDADEDGEEEDEGVGEEMEEGE